MRTEPRERPAERMLRHALGAVVLIGLLSGVVNLLILVSPIYMFQIFDRVLLTFRIETLLYLTLIAAFCVLVLGILDALRGMAVARLGRWWDESARADVFDAALAATRVQGPQVGVPLNDLQQVRGFVGSPGILPFFDAPWTPFFILVIFLLHPWLGVLALASALVLLCFAFANDLLSRKALAGLAPPQAANAAFATTALRNADVVHAMGMQPAVVGLHEARQQEVNALSQKGAERTAVVTGASKAVRIGVQVGMLGLGAWLVTRHQLTAGGMIAAAIILGRALGPIEQGIGSWRAFTGAREAHRRIQALLKSVSPEAEPTALSAPSGKLSVENLTFILPGRSQAVLRQVGFQLEPGTVLAVVGPSAAGKSTLCRLLVGSWQPNVGHVRLDGADLAHWRSADRARFVGYMPQGIELFGGTVKQNIARFGEATDEAVVEAAQRAGCHEMILHLPHGYDSEIGEGGVFLSGGQRQRIALARALLGAPRLVILDEPNSNLDQEGESALLAAIVNIKRNGTTVVLVSHRFAMMRVVDTIAVLRGGALEKFGPRDQMLEELKAVPHKASERVTALAEASGIGDRTRGVAVLRSDCRRDGYGLSGVCPESTVAVRISAPIAERKRSIVGHRIAQIGQEIAAIERVNEGLAEQLAIIKDEIADKEQLLAKKLLRKPEVLVLRRARADLKSRIASNEATVARAEQRIDELRLGLLSLDTEFRDSVAKELMRVNSELADLEEAMVSSEDVFARTEIRAATSGTVLNLRIGTIGGVVRPGEPILDLVPTDEDLLIEARLSPNDIDVVASGQAARIHLTPFAARHMPALDGTLVHISSDSIMDETTRERYYELRIRVEPTSLARLAANIVLLPGMPAEVYIATGEQSLFRYLAAPVTRSFRRAFREG